MEITCIADLHGYYPKLDGGDLLIVAGDLTARDTVLEHMKFQMWLHDQDYEKKILIAGNHDNRLQELPFEGIRRHYAETGEGYLCDSGTEILYYPFLDPPNLENPGIPYKRKTVRIWGSPWTLTFPGINPRCTAFTGTEEELEAKFAMIPQSIDILVTHGPAYGVLDELKILRNGQVVHAGSESLIKPMIKSGCKYHIYGHIHEAYGKFVNPILGITYINCSHVNERYEPVNAPVRIVL